MLVRDTISVLILATVLGVAMAFVGLLAGAVHSIGGFLWELVTGTLNRGTLLAFGALIGMPVVFGFFGFVAGLIGGFLFKAIWARPVIFG